MSQTSVLKWAQYTPDPGVADREEVGYLAEQQVELGVLHLPHPKTDSWSKSKNFS